MRTRTAQRQFLAAAAAAVPLLALLSNASALPDSIAPRPSRLQAPLEDLTVAHHQNPQQQASQPRLHGRFLHITDIHPDQHYKIHASTAEDEACHSGKGSSGIYGAETTDCDTPFALVNATFDWIEENIRDSIDFVVWTGDSARHDSDEKIPRTPYEVLNTNTLIADKFAKVFGNDDRPGNPLKIPIITTFGNNDILPHNILLSGPNKWLRAYSSIWNKFIPEEQRHGFERGGWYHVDVIPNKLAVFSLNTLYFFNNNAAVDGCSLRSEPGYEHMEWLRIQLQIIRERGMKAILIGHVPPARTDSKQLWDETCWQKYTLWLRQYRDVVVGALYGHMNIDHFMLQDTMDVDIDSLSGVPAQIGDVRSAIEDDLSVQSAADYLEELRVDWSELPNPAAAFRYTEDSEIDEDDLSVDASKRKKKRKGKKGKKSKKDKLLKKIGGPWGERFHVTHVGPSVVPNYFPTLRIVEYNITGLESNAVAANPSTTTSAEALDSLDGFDDSADISSCGFVRDEDCEELDSSDSESIMRKKRKKHRKHKKPKNPDLTVPDPPSKSAPPGPAYSPQTLTLLGYTQYFANLTYINNDSFVKSDSVEEERWHEGKHKGKHPKDKIPHPRPFQYEVEYDTFNDSIYKLEDLTVRSYIKLAHRIGQYKPEKGDGIDDLGHEIENTDGELELEPDEDDEDDSDESFDAEGKKKKHKKHKKQKHHRQKEKNKVWLQFLKRAFIGTLDEEDLKSFSVGTVSLEEQEQQELHNGEL